MSYRDYAEKYLASGGGYDSLEGASLYSISDYLQNNDNYKIYEAFDDFFLNKEQIKKLKSITGDKLSCLNCGAHLGFLYRPEFLTDLKNTLFNNGSS